ncbi:MAG TPA: hypothetical protein VK563_16065 [Puia sp.]|nr:hypothetical protein [Puia sp.]
MMRRINSISILSVLVACLSLASCDSNSSSGEKLKLLTHSPWKYEKAGFGSDDDGVFNALDPRIAGNEKDNTIFFRTDGSGAFVQCSVKGKLPRADSLPFMWAFQNNDSTIYFRDQYYKLQELNNDHMVIYADQKLGGVNRRYTIVFRHAANKQ